MAAAEDARHLAVAHAVQLGALLDIGQVFVHFGPLLRRRQFVHQLRLGRQHHERHAENRVGARRKNSEMPLAVGHLEFHFGAFGTADPVALRLLDGLRPVDGVESVEQPLRVGRRAQAPLPHLLLHHGIAAALAHAVHHLVVGQHRAQSRAPVDHRLAQVGDAVVHERLLLLHLAHGAPLLGRKPQFLALRRVESFGAPRLETLHQLFDGTGLPAVVAEVAVEHPLEGPLRPVVVIRVAGAHLAVPVEREAYLVQLAAISLDVLLGRLGRVLPRLDGVLLGGESVAS